jgi:hypothetical protein
LGEHLYRFDDCLTSSFGRSRIFLAKKIPQTLQVSQCRTRKV